MDASSSSINASSPASTPSTLLPDAIDPLVAQMNSVLRFASTQQQPSRERRRSDTDPVITGRSSQPESPTSVRSRDGMRWLPAPEAHIRTHTIGLGKDTCDMLGTLGHTSLPPLRLHCCINEASVCAMVKVFGTTELLELILSFLSTRNIMSIRRTSHKWNATIEESPQLRLHLFALPQWCRPSAEFSLLPCKLPGLDIQRGESLHLGQWIIVTMTYDAARLILPESRPEQRVRSRSFFEGIRGGLGPTRNIPRLLGPKQSVKRPIRTSLRHKDLYLTQPPIVGTQAFGQADGSTTPEMHGSEDPGDPAPDAKLSCDAGITLGFLAETAQSLLSDKSGQVVFKAIVSFIAPEQAPRKRASARRVMKVG